MSILETKHWLIGFDNEWSQLWGKYNWYTFTLIEVRFENDKTTYGYEFEMWLIGLCVRIRYNTDKSLELFEKWNDEAKDAVGCSGI